MNETDIKQDAPAMPDEQAAELAALTAFANEQQEPGAPEVPGQEQDSAPAVPLADQIAGLLGMLVGVSAPLFPSLTAIYSPEVCEQVGRVLEPVCNKHGWLQDGVAGKYGEEMMALIVVGPLAYATYTGISADIEARKPKEQKTLPVAASGPARIDAKANGDESRLDFTVGKVIPHENS